MNKRINKKGFTLIELLATILVLAIIMMIAYPKIRKVIDESKRSAFLTTAKGILISTDNYYGLKTSKNEFTPGLVYDLDSGDTIKFTGGDFKTGEVTIDEYGNTALALWDGTYCIVKSFDDENDELTIVKNKTGANCNVENIDKMIHYGTTGYLCADPGSTIATEAKYFTFNQATKTITAYSDLGPKNLVIPCTIGGVNVENIASSAFSSKSLTSVLMPDTIITIGEGAFYSNLIATLELGNSVQTIGSYAFYTNKITTLVLPDSLKTLGDSPSYLSWGVFSNNLITSVTFGSGITTIGTHAFYSNPLSTVNFSRSSNLTTIKSYAFQSNQITTLDLANCTSLITIGNSVFSGNKIVNLKLTGNNLTIGEGVFSSNLLENITYEGKIIGIGTDAFKNNQLPDEEAFIYGRDVNGNTTTTLVSYGGANRSNITIPNTITSLANASFSGLGLNGTLNTGNGLTTVESGKFSSNALTNVIIGNSVTTIGSSAFSSNMLTNVSIGNSVITIGEGAFYTNQIATLNLGTSVQTIGSYAFYTNKITTLVLPDSLKTLGDSPNYLSWGVFSGNLITSVTFGSGITTIGTYAFYGNPLSTVNFSRSSSLTTIKSYAFQSDQITTLDLTNCTSLTTIGASAFNGNKIISLDFAGDNLTIGNSAFYTNKIISLNLTGNNLTIGESAFASNLLESITYEGKIIGIGIDAFKNNQLPDEEAFIYGRDINGNTTTTLVSYGGANRSNITIPNTITSLANASFSGLGLTGTLNTGDGLTTVESSKFSSNTLTNVIVGNSVTTIGSSAFSSNMLTNVSIGNSVITIGEGAFYTNQIATLNLGTSVQTIGSYAFYTNKITTLVLPDSLKTLGDSPNYLSWGVFSGNLITSVTFGSGITTIGTYAFYGNPLSTVNFSRSSNLTTIKSYAFQSDQITTLDLTNCTSLITIGTSAFYGNKITSLNFVGDNLTIGNSAFYNNKIISLNLTGNNLTIGESAFSSNLLTNITYGGKIIGIGIDAFKNNQLPDEEAFIYGRDVSGNTTTTLVSYGGANRSNITIPNTITSLANASFSGLGLTGTLNTGDGLTTVESGKFSSNTLTNVIVGNSVTAIGSSAFSSNIITNVSIGNSVISIGEGAFYSNQISTLDLGDSVQTIGSYAFYTNKITTLVLPDSLKTLGDSPNYLSWGVFSNNLITSVSFGNGITTIGTYAFYSNPLGSIEIPGVTTTIKSYAFLSMTSGNTILLKGKVDSTNFLSLGTNWSGSGTVIYELSSCYTYSGNAITDYASACSKKPEIPTTLGGNTITTIAANSFASKGLYNATIPSSVTTIGDNAFNGNTMEAIGVSGKTSSSDFSSLGTNWSGGNSVAYGNNNASCFVMNSGIVSKYYDIGVCSRNMIIPNGVTEIANNAFANDNLISATLPSSIQTIGNTPFSGYLLSSMTVNSGTNFTTLGTDWKGNLLKVNFLGTSVENNCYNVTGNSITKYQSYCPETVVVPASVEGTPITSLAANSFKGSAVRYITIPSTIISIGNNAFEGNDIVTLSLVSGLDTIGASAFKDTGLLTLTLPNTVENIGADAFKDNAGLTVINVQGKTSPADFTSLGSGWNGSCSNIVYLGG